MAQATIGALKVDLSLNSAQFATGLKQAETGLSRFSRVTGIALAAAAAAAATAAVAIGHAVKAAADHADTLSKTAQKVGVTTEALSRLEWAAKLSDVSLETLSTGLRKLSQNLLDVALGRGEQASTAFKALGISVKDAAGNLRQSDDVLAEVADRFARLEDGSTKTALAMSLFGRSGSELIPLLNSGRDGLKAMADESDRLGQTISTKTGKAAEQFNDNLTRISASLQGVANRILEEALPALVSTTNALAGLSPEAVKVGTTAVVAATAVAGLGLAAKVAAPGVAVLTASLGGLATVLGTIAAIPGAMAFLAGGAYLASTTPAGGQSEVDFERQVMGRVNAFKALNESLGSGQFSAPDENFFAGIFNDTSLKPFTVDLDALATTATKAKEAIDPFAARMQELAPFLEQTHDPFEQMKMDLTDLDTMWRNGRISTEQYGEAVKRVNLGAISSTLGMAGQVAGALSGLFKDNKAFAVASAVINTAEGVTKALAQGGLFGFVGAAAVAAAGAAQVAAIFSAEPGSASMPSPPSVAAPEVAGPGGGGPNTAVSIRVDGGVFSRDAVLKLVDDINAALGDRAGSMNFRAA